MGSMRTPELILCVCVLHNGRLLYYSKRIEFLVHGSEILPGP